MRKSWLAFIILVALVGAVVAGYSLKLYYQIQTVGFEQSSICNLGPTMNCEVVQMSSFAAVAGLPVSGLGLCYYIFVMLMALAVWLVPTAGVTAARFGWLLGVGTFLYSALLAYVSATLLHVWCPTCIIMYAVNLLLWFAWWLAGRVHPAQVLRHMATVWQPAVGMLAVFGIGTILMLGKAMATQRATPRQIQDALYAYEKGSPHTLPDTWEGHPVWGNPNAKTTIVEFSDMECPFCRLAAINFLPSLIDFKNDVRVVFVNYPLDQSCNKNMQFPGHPHSCMAAVATMCAFNQGKFWEYSEDVFRDQRRISREMLLKIAERHHLDMPAFTQCLDAQESMPLVQRDIAIGEKAMVTSTPSVFVNGKPFPYWRVPQVVRKVMESVIKR
jgi:protein-disulfide isomerase/uncharacterized membrane protein